MGNWTSDCDAALLVGHEAFSFLEGQGLPPDLRFQLVTVQLELVQGVERFRAPLLRLVGQDLAARLQGFQLAGRLLDPISDRGHGFG
jgi:hypothetical protein